MIRPDLRDPRLILLVSATALLLATFGAPTVEVTRPGYDLLAIASGGPVFEGKVGETRGLIVGTGSHELSPIPKFDDKGREVGFIAIDEVPHESRFGLPPKGAEQREGFNARNAPFGATAAVGVEHLSSVKEEYLRTLSEKTGLGYFHLNDRASLLDAYRAAGTERPRAGALDIRPFLGGLSAACLFGAFSIAPLLERLARKRLA